MTGDPMNTTLLNKPRAQRLLAEAGVDGLLGASFENVLYLSGLWSENFFVLPHQTQVYAIVSRDKLDRPHVVAGLAEAANIFQACPADATVYLYGTFFRAVNSEGALSDLEAFVKGRVVDKQDQKPFPSVVDAAVAALEEAGLARGTIAYDERMVFPEHVADLQRRLANASFVPGYRLFRRIRAVKTEEEQRRLKAALALNERAIYAAMGIAQVGVTEQEMIEEFERTVVGGGGKAMFTQLVFGRRGGHGNVMKREVKLGPGDVIRFDVGCMVEGYNSDIARNFTLEEPSRRVRDYYAAVLHGEEVAAAALRPGTTANEVFATTVEAIRAAGIPHYARHHVGHGIGLEVYDIPTLMPSDDTPIEAGMVFQVETPYYELGWAGLQPEDTVLVTEQGGRFLYSISRQLEVWPAVGEPVGAGA
jgi:Xaa-Pro aminopeptidase